LTVPPYTGGQGADALGNLGALTGMPDTTNFLQSLGLGGAPGTGSLNANLGSMGLPGIG